MRGACKEVERKVHAVCLKASLNRVEVGSGTATPSSSRRQSILTPGPDHLHRRRSRPEVKKAEWSAYLNLLLRSVRSSSGCPTPQETLLTASFTYIEIEVRLKVVGFDCGLEGCFDTEERLETGRARKDA